MKKITYFYAVIIVIITTLTYGCSSPPPNITIENIQTAIIGKNTNEGLMSWKFAKDEPKDITIIESKYDGEKATIIIDMTTKQDQETMNSLLQNVLEPQYMSGKLRLHCEYIAKEWNILSLDNLSFRQVSIEDLMENVEFDEKEIEAIIQKHIQENYPTHIKLGIQDKNYINENSKGIKFFEEEGLIKLLPNSEIVLAEKGKSYPHIIYKNYVFFFMYERKLKDITSINQKGNEIEVRFKYLSLLNKNDLFKKSLIVRGLNLEEIQTEWEAKAALNYDIFAKKLTFKGFESFILKKNEWVSPYWVDDDNSIKKGIIK